LAHAGKESESFVSNIQEPEDRLTIKQGEVEACLVKTLEVGKLAGR